MKINSNLCNLESVNIFANVSKKVADYKKENPDKDFISLGIGDVSKPIAKPIIEAMHKAVDDLSNMKTFKGYGPTHGYDFLKQAILDNEYKDLDLSLDEIYISNGTKPDSTNILELFSIDAKICITDAMYPIYRDGAISLNRKVTVLKMDETDFIPNVPKEKYDVIYICSPSNPIGIAYTYEELEKWVKYALENDAVILYDNAYESFVRSKNVPHSIYEIKDAKKVAIEFKSFSKKASFTGVRCSYYIIPNEISENVNDIWKRRTINRFNGADYVAQRGAEAVYLEESQKKIKENIDYYMENAKILRACFLDNGYQVWGGIDCPFMWIKTKNNMSSWDAFELFLKKLNIVIIPGIIFGIGGTNYFRVSALGSHESILKAIERINEYEKI